MKNEELKPVIVKTITGEKAGYFHGWGTIPFPNDNGMYLQITVGIVQLEGGVIDTVKPTSLRFV